MTAGKLTAAEKMIRHSRIALKPQGYRVLGEFLVEVENRTIPETAAVAALVKAFTQMIDEDAEPMQALGLKWGRGEKAPATWQDNVKRYDQVWRYIVRKLDAEQPEKPRAPRGALARAIEAASRHFSRDTRTIQRAWKNYAPSYHALRLNRWQCELMLAHLTAEELEVVGPAPGQIAVYIALARKRGRPLGDTFESEVAAAAARYKSTARK